MNLRVYRKGLMQADKRTWVVTVICSGRVGQNNHLGCIIKEYLYSSGGEGKLCSLLV